ncbi:hypothetical protein [Nonomuraea typhae]|uniref:hypothetical protein n=1 Tax=Nonomuraea typhae TaxID=2603600 RepID=UPI0015E1D3BD|nr:hypothetical protein [Nonomuraea typhae]
MINQLTTVTKEVVEAARENLIIGVMRDPRLRGQPAPHRTNNSGPAEAGPEPCYQDDDLAT